MELEPEAGFRKLNFLLSNPPFPPETFANLLLLYAKHHYYDLAADVLAENAHLTYKWLPPRDPALSMCAHRPHNTPPAPSPALLPRQVPLSGAVRVPGRHAWRADGA